MVGFIGLVALVHALLLEKCPLSVGVLGHEVQVSGEFLDVAAVGSVS